jgi:hypothetical protein
MPKRQIHRDNSTKGVIIPINDKYRVTSDARCWIIEHMTIQGWKATEYFADMEQLSKRLFHRLLNERAPEGIEAVVREAENVRREISQIFNPKKVTPHVEPPSAKAHAHIAQVSRTTISAPICSHLCIAAFIESASRVNPHRWQNPHRPGQRLMPASCSYSDRG